MGDRPIKTLEEACAVLENDYARIVGVLYQGDVAASFTAKQWLDNYTLVYDVCTQKPPFNFSLQMYNHYRASCNKHVAEHVLPSLRSSARGEPLLRELLSRWDRHVVLVRWLSRFYNYLDRYYIQRHKLTPLCDAGQHCFRDGVRGEPGLERALADAVAELAQRQRGGEQVDSELVSKVGKVMELLGISADAEQHDEAHPAAAAAPK